MISVSDKIFQKRKARKKADSKRVQKIREQYKIILIVCEGKKTEVNYFSQMIRELDLPGAYVKVKGDVGSAPISVVNYGIKAYEDPQKTIGVDFINEVYCVVDRDMHYSFFEANNACENYITNEKTDVFKFIYSNPSFEYWLLLHYKYTDSPYAKKQNKTVSDCVIDDLKRYVPDYSKSAGDIYDFFSCKTSVAIENAEKRNRSIDGSRFENPCTNIHILIKRLLEYRAG